MADEGAHPYGAGDIIPWHIMPGVVVASYFVSLSGAITTVEILHRRTEGRGWKSWLQLLAVSISFGLVAIWCMHFVGNRAIILGDGRDSLQLTYNPGFTALSAFLPIIFLFFGFTVVDMRRPGHKLFWPSLMISGIVAGLAITGMHYVGNFGIQDYKVRNPVGYVIGAAVIAIAACMVALSLFFYFREQWISSLPRRLFCAMVLAGAVSGMHWTATVGTSYRLISVKNLQGSNRNINLIIAIVLSVLACISCLAIIYFTQRRKKEIADRAQHVVLASVTFDPEGKLLVTQEGLLPCQKITRQFNHRSFDDEFNVAHPVFQWLFRVSHNWTGVADLVPAMRGHLRASGSLKEASGASSPEVGLWANHNAGEEDYSIIFREYFCVAASQLADMLSTPLSNLGVPHGEVMTTGSMASDLLPRRPLRGGAIATVDDIERGRLPPAVFGKGQLLLLVRHVEKSEANRLLTSGYRFAHISQVSDILARSMQVPQNEPVRVIERISRQHRSEDPRRESPQVPTFLGCFALRPAFKPSTGNWDVLVPKGNPSQLPQVQLSPDQLKPWQLDILKRYEGRTVSHCIQSLKLKADDHNGDEESAFMARFLNRIFALLEQVPEPWFRQAILSTTSIRAHSQRLGEVFAAEATIFAFCIIPDVHASLVKTTDKLSYTPYSFFRCRQQVYRNSPDHAILARRIHLEFAPRLAHAEISNMISTSRESLPKSGGRSNRTKRAWPFPTRDSSHRNSMMDASSERGLVCSPTKDLERTKAFGGIMVSTDIHTVENDKDDAQLEMAQIGTRAEAGIAELEQPTFVDELFRITSHRWQGS